MMHSGVQFFNEFGFAGPFRLDDPDPVRRLGSFVRGHPHHGQWNWVLSRLGLARDQRIDQPHGHIALRPLYDLATRKQVLDDVEDLLGPDVLLWKGRIIGRDPGDEGQGWHVDHDNMLLNGVHVTVVSPT